MIVRELVHLISFKMNEASYASMESRIKKLSGFMSFATTLPIVLLGKSFLTASQKLQTLNLSLETYAKNTAEAKQASKDLITLATNMPTAQVEDLGEATNNLLARGVPMKDLVSTFKMFYTITGATGGNMKGLAKAYTDTMSKGKLAGQEVNQYVNASVPIYKALSDFLKKPVAAIKEMQKKGEITFEVLKGALMDLTKEGSAFANIMQKKSETLYAAWLRLKDMWFVVSAQLGDKLGKPLGIVVGYVTELVKAFSALDDNWKRFIIIFLGTAAVVPVLVTILMLLSRFGGPLAAVTVGISALAAAIDDLYVWKKGGKSVMGHLFGDYNQYKEHISALKTLFADMLEFAKTVVKQPLDIGKWLVGENGNLKMVLDVIGGIAKTIHLIVFDITSMVQMTNALLHGDFKRASEIGSRFNKENMDVLIKPFTNYKQQDFVPSLLQGDVPKVNKIGNYFSGKISSFLSGLSNMQAPNWQLAYPGVPQTNAQAGANLFGWKEPNQTNHITVNVQNSNASAKEIAAETARALVNNTKGKR